MKKPQTGTKVIRSIQSRKELEEVYDLLEQVFPNGRSFFQRRLDHDTSYDFETTWVASMNGTIASTVQLFPFQSWIEEAKIKIAGIGSVATLPEYRGQGLCQEILKQQTCWMEEQGIDLSLLFAVITPFYEKVGWSIVPESVYELALSSLPASPGPLQSSMTVVPFEPSYTEDVRNIYEEFNHARTFTVVRPASFWTDQQQWPRWETSDCLIAQKDGKAVAYGQISMTREGKAQLEELCYLRGEEAAVIPLFQSLAQLRPDAQQMIIKVPDDHVLAEALVSWGANRQEIAYAMWKVIKLYPLLSKLSSVFTRRLGRINGLLDTNIHLHIECEGQHAYLHTTAGELTIEAQARTGISYSEAHFTQPQLISLLFQGMKEEPAAAKPTEWLQALFPTQNSVFYTTDKF